MDKIVEIKYGYPLPEERRVKVPIDVDTCKWVIWGAKNPYNTFGHIHEAFLRVLKFLGKDAVWLDNGDDLSGIDFHNTCFLSMNCVVGGMPRRQDCFYVIHNGNDPACLPFLEGLSTMTYGIHVSTNRYENLMELGPDIYFDLRHRVLMLRWGTDLFPHEIEANKPQKAFNEGSRVYTYVGSIDEMKRQYLEDFSRACRENGIQCNTYGGHGGGRTLSIEEHIQLIKDSYMCPAIQGRDQVEQGYVSCRLFKNISYGQMGLTCSTYANDLFGGKLICNPDAYHLFYDAKERLESMPVKELHDLMDEVAAKHTYLNKIGAIMQAIRLLKEAGESNV